MEHSGEALITNDAVVMGIIMILLAFIFKTSSSSNPFWKKFYKVIPMLLLCYFLPSLLTTLGIVDPEKSQLYFVASRYLLPASLVLPSITCWISSAESASTRGVPLRWTDRTAST